MRYFWYCTVSFVLLVSIYNARAMELENYTEDQFTLDDLNIEQLQNKIAEGKKTLKGLTLKHRLATNQLDTERKKQYKKQMQWLTGTHCVYFLASSLLQIGDPRLQKRPQPFEAWQPEVAAWCSLIVSISNAILLTDYWK